MSNIIQLEQVTINKNQVTFKSGCTTYANEYRVETVDIDQLMKRFKVLCKNLKNLGCSVSHKYKQRKFIFDNKSQYELAINEYNGNFNCMKALAETITSKPLEVGTSDNEELNTMYMHRNKCIIMLNRTTLISKVLDFKNKIESLENDLKDEDFTYTKVTF